MAILECRELTKYFDSSLALDHVSLTVEPGRIVGLLGPNGSGKSTLIKLANGLLVPSSGVVTIDGHAPGPETKELVSYLPDEPIGGVDPATRDYIIHTILSNYNENASLVISTHLIADVENVLDDVIFINKGRILLQQSVDQIRQEKGCSVDELFREVFRYAE